MSDSFPHGEDKEVQQSVNERKEDHPSVNSNESGAQTNVDDNDEFEGPTSSVENIIPLNKLRNGWLALSAFVAVSSTMLERFVILSVYYLQHDPQYIISK